MFRSRPELKKCPEMILVKQKKNCIFFTHSSVFPVDAPSSLAVVTMATHFLKFAPLFFSTCHIWLLSYRRTPSDKGWCAPPTHPQPPQQTDGDSSPNKLWSALHNTTLIRFIVDLGRLICTWLPINNVKEAKQSQHRGDTSTALRWLSGWFQEGYLQRLSGLL